MKYWNKKRRHYSQGFTLIEVLIAVAIFSILALAGTASYNRFNRSQRVRQAAEDFAKDLEVYRKRVDSGEQPTFCNPAPPAPPMPLNEYYIDTIGIDSPNFDVKLSCGGMTDISVDALRLRNDAVFGDRYIIHFPHPLSGFAYNDVDIVIRDENGTNQETVLIRNGVVSVVD